jgi:hypothetical protein
VEAALGAAQSLIHSHIPFGVISKKNLAELSRHQVIVLPNVLMMDEEETDALRRYVRAGGSLYASRYSSLVTKKGQRQSDFLLADVFGATYRGQTKERFTYIAPDGAASQYQDGLFSGITDKHPLGVPEPQMLIEATAGAVVLGKLVLPYTDPSDPVRFASIHNNPPGIQTDHPAIVMNYFGKGQVVYVSGDIESHEASRDVFVGLIRLLAGHFSFGADAPKPVEITMFHQPERRRFIASALNFQKDLPNIPVDGIRLRISVGQRVVQRLLLLPSEQELDYQAFDGFIQVCLPRLDTFLMIALEY